MSESSESEVFGSELEVLDTLNDVIAKYDDVVEEDNQGVDTIRSEDTIKSSDTLKQRSAGNIQKPYLTHQKHGSDCTLINQEMEFTMEASKSPENVSKLKMLFASAFQTKSKQQKDLHFSDMDIKEKETDSGTEYSDEERDLFSNLRILIRGGSRRFSFKLKKKNTKDEEYIPINQETFESPNATPKESAMDAVGFEEIDNVTENLNESGLGFEEFCRPVFGYLQHSVSSPVTLHQKFNDEVSWIDQAKREAKLKNRTIPFSMDRRKFEIIDSGFESCSSFTRKMKYRKKLNIPSQLSCKKPSFGTYGNMDNFQFKEAGSFDESFMEAISPAINSVSDDDNEEVVDRSEIFLGDFPKGKSKFPLRRYEDKCCDSSSSVVFRDSDNDDVMLNLPPHLKSLRNYSSGSMHSKASGSSSNPEVLNKLLDDDKDSDLIISTYPGDDDSLEEILNENYDRIEMICNSSVVPESKILSGKVVLWTSDFKKKIKKVFISKHQSMADIPENAIKLRRDELNRWSVSHGACSSSRSDIILSLETDTERSESVSTSATSPLLEGDINDDFLSYDEELYYKMCEEMRNLDDMEVYEGEDYPVSVIDYKNYFQ